MSEDSGGDDLAEVEAMLREIDVDDLDIRTPPPTVWAGIEREVANDPVVHLKTRGRHRGRWILAAAAAVVLVAVVAGTLLANRESDKVVVSSAVLEHDPVTFDPLGAGSAATAELIERDGYYEIRLIGAQFPPLDEDADLELWLIEPDSNGNPVDVVPVSVVVDSATGTYRVPDELDPTSHNVVDISIEPHDGDEAHSGRSILRGALQPV